MNYKFLFPMLLISFAACTNSPKEEPQSKIAPADSLLQLENIRLKNQLEALRKDTVAKEQEIKINTLIGSFHDAFLGDCFHLSFKDTLGKTWEFGNPDNIYGINLFEATSDFELKKKMKNKKFKIWYANLKGIDCQSSESYVEAEKTFVDMPTIIRVEEFKMK